MEGRTSDFRPESSHDPTLTAGRKPITWMLAARHQERKHNLMLRQLHFTNFKTWEKADIEFAPITLLFGANSSGKSSLLQFLLLLKQTKETTDRALALDLGGPYISLGTYHDLVFRHDDKLEIEWCLHWKPDKKIRVQDLSAEPAVDLVESDLVSVGGRIVGSEGPARARELTYAIDNDRFSLKPVKANGVFLLAYEGEKNFEFTRDRGRPPALPGPVKSYGFPDQARTYFKNSGFLADLEAAFEVEMDRIAYLGPLREHPKREYRWTRARPSGVGQRGENAVEAILAATVAEEKRNLKRGLRLKPFQEMIAYWLREIGLVADFRVEEIKQGSNLWQALLQVVKGAPKVLLTEVGFGVSQVLPVITLLYYVPEGSTVILEQPEIHLHPAAQAGLADVVINVANHRRVQVIVETHSEHFLLRMQRRMAEEKLAADRTRFYFCRLDKGQSALERLEVDLLGNIANWPDGFFGDSFGEIAGAEKSRLKRQISA